MAENETECPTCGNDAGDHGHMCVPRGFDDKKCDWCGSIIPDARHLCSDKVQELSHICNNCGRAAVNPEYLCMPKKIL